MARAILPTRHPSARLCPPYASTVKSGGERPSALFLLLQHAPGHGVELLQQRRIPRLRRGDQRGIERTVRADRTRLVLARKVAGQAQIGRAPCRERGWIAREAE